MCVCERETECVCENVCVCEIECMCENVYVREYVCVCETVWCVCMCVRQRECV